MIEETSEAALFSKIAAFTEILSKDPLSTIFVTLAESYRKIGHLDDALRIVERGLEVHPDFSPAHVVRARVLCQIADYAGSEAAFTRALELDEGSLAALVGYARLAILNGQEEKARNLLLKARGFSPADPVINKLLNTLPRPVEDEVEPVPEPEQASRFTAPLISETLADLYLKQGLPEKALEILRELLRNDPDNLKLRRLIRDAEEASLAHRPPVTPLPVRDEGTPDLVVDAETAKEEGIAVERPEFSDAPLIEERESATAHPPGEEMTADAVSVKEQVARQPLDVFNQWLKNIDKGRANV
ncbi:MAG: tetratricopeptide repeat protein [Desulfuromonadales bacterium]|nr:tetratricopeptide repeat protein [Desulfuromonadales bacterium]